MFGRYKKKGLEACCITVKGRYLLLEMDVQKNRTVHRYDTQNMGNISKLFFLLLLGSNKGTEVYVPLSLLSTPLGCGGF